MNSGNRFFELAYENSQKHALSMEDVKGGLGQAWDTTKDVAGKAMGGIEDAGYKVKDAVGSVVSGEKFKAVAEGIKTYKWDIVAGLTAAAATAGAYGLTASRRPYESEEDFRKRRAHDTFQNSAMAGVLAGGALPALEWLTGSGRQALKVTKPPGWFKDPVREGGGLPEILGNWNNKVEQSNVGVDPGSSVPALAGGAAGAAGGWVGASMIDKEGNVTGTKFDGAKIKQISNQIDDLYGHDQVLSRMSPSDLDAEIGRQGWHTGTRPAIPPVPASGRTPAFAGRPEYTPQTSAQWRGRVPNTEEVALELQRLHRSMEGARNYDPTSMSARVGRAAFRGNEGAAAGVSRAFRQGSFRGIGALALGVPAAVATDLATGNVNKRIDHWRRGMSQAGN